MKWQITEQMISAACKAVREKLETSRRCLAETAAEFQRGVDMRAPSKSSRAAELMALVVSAGWPRSIPGCTPTKTMIASAQVAHYVRQSAKWGVHTTGVRVAIEEVLKRKNRNVHGLARRVGKQISRSCRAHSPVSRAGSLHRAAQH